MEANQTPQLREPKQSTFLKTQTTRQFSRTFVSRHIFKTNPLFTIIGFLYKYFL